MSGYELSVDLEVLQQLLRVEEDERDRVIELLDRLRREPFLSGDYREPDDTGRANEIILVGNLLVFYWSDHAVKTVRVIKIELVDGD